MGAESGPQDTSLNLEHLERRLHETPFCFEFFQAVRLLGNLSPGRVEVGQFPASPADEVVRFKTNPSLSFPASDIQTLAEGDTHQPVMTVNFMGLLGSHGVLPYCYSEFVLSRNRERDRALGDFLDVFHHRLISFFYQAWRRYRTLERPDGQGRSLPDLLMNLIGMGTDALRKRQAVPDVDFLNYAGLLAQQPRSATALRGILMDYFEIPVQVEQFAGTWAALEDRSLCRLDEEEEDNRCLGFGAVVGDEIWDCKTKVRIVLGPMDRQRYLEFLPQGEAYPRLRAMVRFFSDEVDFEAQLFLFSASTPPCVLGASDGKSALLGWLSWVNTREMNRNPGDTIIPL